MSFSYRAFRPALLSALFLFIAFSVPLSATTLKFQAGKLEEHGGFQVRGEDGIQIITAGGGSGVAPAIGAISLPHGGSWHVWVRSLSMPDDPPKGRNFSVRLGTQKIEKVFGGHHLSVHREFLWEDGGTVNLPIGPVLVVIGEYNSHTAQCGEIMLSDDVSSAAPKELAAHATAATMVPLKRSHTETVTQMPAVTTVSETPVATLNSDDVHISFLQGAMQTPQGVHPALVQRVEVHSAAGWKLLPTGVGADSYRVVFRPSDSHPNLITAYTQYPSWDNSFAPPVTFSAGNASIEAHIGPPTAPWLAGKLFQLRPISAKQIDSETVELGFEPLSIGTLTARWHIIEGQPSAGVKLSFQLTTPGYLSLGYHGLLEDDVLHTDFVMLPYLYLGHRFPTEPITVPSDHTPTPAAMVTEHNISYALLAEPGQIPFAWPGPAQARYAFGIRNEVGLAEPLIYMPILGSPQSLHKTAETATAQFRVWMQEGTWIEAYRRIVTQAYGLSDYRSPVAASLSDSVLNLYDLMKDDAANGWDARAKGPWDIESRNSITQPGPLTFMSFALLTGDKDFYNRYALPSLEYLISRPSAHFAAAPDSGEHVHGNLTLGTPPTAYSAAMYAGAYALTQGSTPAFADLCFKPNGSLNVSHSHQADFDDQLALYEISGDKRWFTSAIASGDRYIAENLTKLPSKDLGVQPFLNVSFTPDWEGLLHLYVITHEQRFLNASAQSAYWLMSTIWTQPSIPAGNITVNPGGKYSGHATVWWKGDHYFHLGMYESPTPSPLSTPAPKAHPVTIPEASVPGWQVSTVGLGLEQPVTYAQGGSNNNIMMSSWAPNLLRLYGYTGDEMYRAYARNATIGRFANYPGYYLTLFTDIYESPEYPIKGPDVTSVYYHHIAPFAAYVQDYVFSDAEIRSKGQYAFPSVRQFGYVWFDNRLRGFAPGKVYGETAWPWINRTAATANNKNVDLVLSHSEHTLYFALMNQTHTPQHVSVRLDPRVLGAAVDGKKARVWIANTPAQKQTVRNNTLDFDLSDYGFTVVAVDDLHIDVPAHKRVPPAMLPIAVNDSLQTKPIAGSTLKAVGTYITTPQFQSRELYVYVKSNRLECGGATLVYSKEEGAEQRQTVNRFPCEFSVPLPVNGPPVQWHIEALRAGSPTE